MRKWPTGREDVASAQARVKLSEMMMDASTQALQWSMVIGLWCWRQYSHA